MSQLKQSSIKSYLLGLKNTYKSLSIKLFTEIDFFIIVASFMLARNDNNLSLFGLVISYWSALVLLKYSNKLMVFLSVSIGIATTVNTNFLLSFFSYVIIFFILNNLKIAKKKSYTNYVIVIASFCSYIVRVMGEVHLLQLPIYLLSTFCLTQVFYLSLDNKLLNITKPHKKEVRLLSLLILIGLTIGGVMPLKFLGLNLYNIGKYTVIIIAAFSSPYIGVIAGVFLGSDIFIGTFNAIGSGQACFMALLLSLSKDYSRLLFLLTAVFSNLLWVWQDGMLSIKTSMFEVIIAVGLFVIYSKLFSKKSNLFDSYSYNQQDTESPILVNNLYQDSSWDQIAQVCDEIAVVLNKSEYQPVDNTHLLQIIEWTGESLCQQCQYYEKCWSKELFLTYHRWRDYFTNFDRMNDNSNKVYSAFPTFCPNKDSLVKEFNNHLNLIRIELYWRHKLQECSSLAVQRLSDFSDMARALSKGYIHQNEIERDIIKRLELELNNNSIKYEKVNVTCTSKKRVFKLNMESCYDYSMCANNIVPLISNVAGGKLVDSVYNCAKHTKEIKCNCKLEFSPTIRLEYGIDSIAATDISGDSYFLDSLDDGRFIALLSDGMGSGHRAQQDSQYALELLQKLLKSGLDLRSVIKLLNTALALGIKQDSFVTIDGIIIDTFIKKAKLIKIGASYTCLKRDRQVKIWKSSTLPVGVFPEVDIDQYDIDLKAGDLMIMLSDGIVDSQRQIIDSEKWLVNIIRELPNMGAKEIASYINKVAIRHCKVDIKDDMTVIVIKVY